MSSLFRRRPLTDISTKMVGLQTPFSVRFLKSEAPGISSVEVLSGDDVVARLQVAHANLGKLEHIGAAVIGALDDFGRARS